MRPYRLWDKMSIGCVVLMMEGHGCCALSWLARPATIATIQMWMQLGNTQMRNILEVKNQQPTTDVQVQHLCNHLSRGRVLARLGLHLQRNQRRRKYPKRERPSKSWFGA